MEVSPNFFYAFLIQTNYLFLWQSRGRRKKKKKPKLQPNKKLEFVLYGNISETS